MIVLSAYLSFHNFPQYKYRRDGQSSERAQSFEVRYNNSVNGSDIISDSILKRHGSLSLLFTRFMNFES